MFGNNEKIDLYIKFDELNNGLIQIHKENVILYDELQDIKRKLNGEPEPKDIPAQPISGVTCLDHIPFGGKLIGGPLY